MILLYKVFPVWSTRITQCVDRMFSGGFPRQSIRHALHRFHNSWLVDDRKGIFVISESLRLRLTPVRSETPHRWWCQASSERNASYSMRWNSMPFLSTERSFHHLPDMPVKNRNAAFCLKCHAIHCFFHPPFALWCRNPQKNCCLRLFPVTKKEAQPSPAMPLSLYFLKSLCQSPWRQ